ncbi:aspartate aminotransferase family protein [Sutcliffiella halmapala]|uniref:aspartate aminotransferase family protein n=1 Tax=Sutcliffiella halmapala TaxID=79882 RepID=UPI000995910E|nr:aspartate aminotransferase family protein [Sutcliffiella halmapala]
MNTYRRFPITFKKGNGSKIWDENETEYLDFTSGIATCNLGHVPEKVKQAIEAQLANLWHTSNLFHIKKQEDLGVLLTENSCFDQVFFCNSGAEANEAAIKLVRAYVVSQNKTNPLIVTFHQSFHGRTLATVSATGQEKIKAGFEPLLQGFIHLEFNDFHSLKMLADISPSAVMLELVQGEGGVIPADQKWVDELVKICKQKEILLVVDEVQTGMGRTGSLFAYEQYGIKPDIMTLAKGLGSGFPIGAMLAKGNVGDAFQPGSHGSTFGGNPLASTAGLATLQEMITSTVLENSEKMSSILFAKLRELQENYSFIKAVRGKGLLIGMEIKGDATKAVELALQEKLLILTAGPNVIRFLPPLTVSKNEIEEFEAKFIKVLEQLKED